MLKRMVYNVIILDTAGRLHIDEEMMEELQEIKNTVEVHQTYSRCRCNDRSGRRECCREL